MADETTPQPDARALLLERMWRHPEGRLHLQDAMAKTFPDAEVPGYETRKVKDEVLAEARTLHADTKKMIEEWKAGQDYGTRVAALRTQGFSPEDITEIERMMKEEGFGTHAAAAESYRYRQQIAAPRTPSSTRMHMPGRGQGAWAKWFNGISEGDGTDWLHDRIAMIRDDFARDPERAPKRWLDENYWPDPTPAQA